METTIQNQKLKAVINHKGAELVSLFKGEKNYIWTVDENFWNKTSPILFPIVGGLKDGKYTFEGKEYHLPRHGFARDFKFELVSKTENSAEFSLNFSEKTLEVYPFEFTLNIKYELIDNQLKINYKIINNDSKKMLFSIGAHPAFATDGNFEDYALEFDKNETLKSYKLENELFSGKTASIELENKKLPLKYALFEKDAIVLKDSATSNLTLLKNDVPQLCVHFSDFPYLGIWTKENAPFLCIEPWLGIADNHNASGNLEEKEGIQILEGNSEKNVEFSIEIF